jgi:acyl carrier protein
MPEEKIRRLRELLAYHSGAPEESLGPDSTPQNTHGWDSVANLGLMAAIEDEFQVTIATRDVLRLKSLGDIAAYLEAQPQHASPA